MVFGEVFDDLFFFETNNKDELGDTGFFECLELAVEDCFGTDSKQTFWNVACKWPEPFRLSTGEYDCAHV